MKDRFGAATMIDSQLAQYKGRDSEPSHVSSRATFESVMAMHGTDKKTFHILYFILI